jgi:hypothetical protein
MVRSAAQEPASQSVRTSSHGTRKAGATQEEIAARIAESQRRRSVQPPRLQCPACAIRVGTVRAIVKHMKGCCPDTIAKPGDGLSLEWLRLEGEEERLAALRTTGGPSPISHGKLEATEAQIRSEAEDLLKSAESNEQRSRDEAIRLAFRYNEHCLHPERLPAYSCLP